MAKYLGEEIVDIKDTEFKDYAKLDWVMYFIEHYGQFDGSHHKAWVLDQVVRICKGTDINVRLARWDDGEYEYRVCLGEPSNEYLEWLEKYKENEDDPEDPYDYDEGIAP